MTLHVWLRTALVSGCVGGGLFCVMASAGWVSQQLGKALPAEVAVITPVIGAVVCAGSRIAGNPNGHFPKASAPSRITMSSNDPEVLAAIGVALQSIPKSATPAEAEAEQLLFGSQPQTYEVEANVATYQAQPEPQILPPQGATNISGNPNGREVSASSIPEAQPPSFEEAQNALEKDLWADENDLFGRGSVGFGSLNNRWD